MSSLKDIHDAARVDGIPIMKDDGIEFLKQYLKEHPEIQKILEERQAVCVGAGGRGLRYTCLINGKRRFLFFEGPRWFVDAAKK